MSRSWPASFALSLTQKVTPSLFRSLPVPFSSRSLIIQYLGIRPARFSLRAGLVVCWARQRQLRERNTTEFRPVNRNLPWERSDAPLSPTKQSLRPPRCSRELGPCNKNHQALYCASF